MYGFKSIELHIFSDNISKLLKGFNDKDLAAFRIVSHTSFQNASNFTRLILLFSSLVRSFKTIQKNKVIFSQNYIFAKLYDPFNNNKLYLMDEGLSSYTGLVERSKRSNNNRKTLKYNFFLYNTPLGIFLYEPRAYIGDLYTFKINSITNNNSNKVKEIIILGSDLNTANTLISKKNYQDENIFKSCLESLMSSLLDLVKHYDFNYRPHPNEKTSWAVYSREQGSLISTGNWELNVASKISDDCILISYFSTAAIMPKLLYGNEPTLIFLFPIIGYEIDGAMDLINRFRMLYNDPSKVHIAKSLSDITRVITHCDNF